MALPAQIKEFRERNSLIYAEGAKSRGTVIGRCSFFPEPIIKIQGRSLAFKIAMCYYMHNK
jgi:hypothetical protein